MNLTIITTNARIERMSKRRQKIALVKRPKNVFTNVYPVAPPELISSSDDTLTFEVSFSYKPQ